jgi:hypothetical protein
MGTLLVMAAENHSTEEVELVRGDETTFAEAGSIEERSLASLGMTNKEKQTQEPIYRSAVTKLGNTRANPKMRARVW